VNVKAWYDGDLRWQSSFVCWVAVQLNCTSCFVASFRLNVTAYYCTWHVSPLFPFQQEMFTVKTDRTLVSVRNHAPIMRHLIQENVSRTHASKCFPLHPLTLSSVLEQKSLSLLVRVCWFYCEEYTCLWYSNTFGVHWFWMVAS